MSNEQRVPSLHYIVQIYITAVCKHFVSYCIHLFNFIG